MNIAVVGTGYVGLVSGTCFSELGANVCCIDVDKEKVSKLKAGEIPIYEEGLQEMFENNTKAGRLTFTTDLRDCLDDVEIVFIAVGTPPNEDGSADVSHVLDVARTFGANIKRYTLLVTKSTVPIGTAGKVKDVIMEELEKRGEEIPFDVASNPEFLMEGSATRDFMKPERVVIGTDSERAKALLTSLYRPMLLNKFRVFFMDIPSAEMTKYVANSMLATRISFMNEVAALCEKTGADINHVRQGVGSDSRIGDKFLYAGCGYGGSCFPKDVRALTRTADENGLKMKVIEAVSEVNEAQKGIVYEKLKAALGGSVKGKTIAVWGLSFKPGTDDIREAPSCTVIRLLVENGAKVRATDPIAMDNFRKVCGKGVKLCNTLLETVEDADAVALITEWKQYRMVPWEEVRRKMKGNVIVDGRNVYDPDEIMTYGFFYYGIGRG
ncbi:MAG: UDP-glucose/GDP-mannose dehydrogenase family protein [Bacteroidales bacterium]|jgi:UDPglucose 6-dehydrogenase|nr:UDP-glucose/GDP-mannose dehydrogenase family protein [Bacteroidales bacterium]MCI2121798.1 UDP-glucose/GDP-mannose dehydrogenase family protein [Bacteroidales bacterium]MCI2146029.1 UDP-glucose/GDP-mannose dehydrogenase family protein [Bacteroidales bacterium]